MSAPAMVLTSPTGQGCVKAAVAQSSQDSASYWPAVTDGLEGLSTCPFTQALGPMTLQQERLSHSLAID